MILYTGAGWFANALEKQKAMNMLSVFYKWHDRMILLEMLVSVT